MYETVGDPIGQANVLRNMAQVNDLAMPERVRLLRAALDLVPGDVAPNVRAVIMSDIALKLTVDSGSPEVDPTDYLEGENLTREALELAKAHGWHDRIQEDAYNLTCILLARSRPRQALELAAEALTSDIASPAIRVAFLIKAADAALQVEDVSLAARSYEEARRVVDRVGATRLQQLLVSKLQYHDDVVEQLARLTDRFHVPSPSRP